MCNSVQLLDAYCTTCILTFSSVRYKFIHIPLPAGNPMDFLVGVFQAADCCCQLLVNTGK